MKKIDYYAVQQPWKMPKWLGATLGGIFAVIAVGSAFAIHDLTKSKAEPAPVAVVAPAATVTSPQTAVVTPTAQAQAVNPVIVKPAHERGARHHAVHASAKKQRGGSKALAKRMVAPDKAASILAKRDTKGNRKAKDDLDKLLGL